MPDIPVPFAPEVEVPLPGAAVVPSVRGEEGAVGGTVVVLPVLPVLGVVVTVGGTVVVGLCIEPGVGAVGVLATSQWNGSNSELGSAQLGLREAKMINGAATTTITPIKSTANHTVLLPVAIWLGGIKLNTKASNEPRKPKPPTSHINPLPLWPMRNGRPAFFIE